MNQSPFINSPFSLAIATGYSLISIILIAPIYYQYSLINPGYMNFYRAMGADLPGITQLILRVYELSYLFSLLVVGIAIVFYIKNKKSGSSKVLFIILNIALVLSLVWREFAMYALQLPAFEMMRIQ